MCCSLYLTLDQQVVFSIARITGVANLPLRMWSSSKKHQLLLTWAPGLGVDRGHKADALPLSYSHIPHDHIKNDLISFFDHFDHKKYSIMI